MCLRCKRKQQTDGPKMASKQHKIFLSDPLFCPNCGSIFPLPGLADVVTCKVCKFQKDTKGVILFAVKTAPLNSLEQALSFLFRI